MNESFRQTLPGDPAAVEAAGAWVGAIAKSKQPELVGLAVRAVRTLIAEAIRHTPPGEQVQLLVTPVSHGLRIEVEDPGAPATAEDSSEIQDLVSWADLSREVGQFGTEHTMDQPHRAWVLITAVPGPA